MLEELKLVKDENRDDPVNCVSLFSDNVDVHELAVLEEALKAVGIPLRAYTTSDGRKMVSFDLNSEKYKKLRTRNAGRKKDYHMDARYEECTVSELKTKLKSMAKKDIIKELGCPKSTFYRIMKKLTESGCDFENADAFYDGMSIWIFTN